ncbi:MAG: thiamine-phosphate kinase [Gemmatimonadota bacterium]
MKLGQGEEFRAIEAFVDAAGAGPMGQDASDPDARLAGAAGRFHRPGEIVLGPGDDAALVEGGSGVLVLSCDTSVEGVHFRRDWISLEESGYRATAAALSDLAAMAARPVGILVGLHVPPGGGASLPPLARGVGRACREAGAALLGGDLTSTSGPLSLDVTVVGRSHAPVSRRGAHAGEEIWVTGELGGSAGAVEAWRRGESPSDGLRKRYAHPLPRLREALWLGQQGVPSSLMDISDGLAGDVGHLAAASGLSAVLDGVTIPVDGNLEREGYSGAEALQLALTGGEDFELLFTAPRGRVEAIQEMFHAAFQLRITCVGRMEMGSGVAWVSEPGGLPQPLSGGGFDHLALGGGVALEGGGA